MINNGRTKHQKFLLFLIIKELFIEFKQQYQIVRISFSIFCKLGTLNHNKMHLVGVCQYHQNV